MFVVDPRVSDEEVVTMTQDYKTMLTAGNTVEITGEENWGRRKLAYPINKVSEGKYVLLFLQSPDGKNTLHEVEHRLRQNDKVLRFLTVRTDEDLKRAARKNQAPPSGGGSAASDESEDDDIESGEEV
jgi:small subunit ribosomal protein S6